MSPVELRNFWDGQTRALMAVTVLLTLTGLVVLLGATRGSPNLGQPWQRQALWFCVGLVALPVVVLIDFRVHLRHSYLYYGLILLVLLLTEVYGTQVYGSKSWLALPLLGTRFQPSEFAKLAVILVLAQVLAKREGQISGLRDLGWPLMLVAIPALLILRQPDLGTALVLVPIALGMFYMAGLAWVYLVLFIAPLAGFLALAPGSGATVLWLAGLILITYLMRRQAVPVVDRLVFWVLYIGAYAGMPKLWEALKPHQKSRFLVFWDPTYELDGAGYNLLQSKIAIGSGGFFGKGFGQGTQTRLEFLPKFHTDFTFAVLAEDWGFVGCMVFFALFLSLLYLCFRVARGTRDYSGGLLASGIAIYFLTHFAINVGMAMGMLPVTGLPLSFLSYGGSHLLACLIGIGLALNVKLRRFQ